MTHLDLTALTKQQLTALLWELKSTPAVYPNYQKLRTQSPKVTINLSDPDWENKTDEVLKQVLGIAKHSSQQV